MTSGQKVDHVTSGQKADHVTSGQKVDHVTSGQKVDHVTIALLGNSTKIPCPPGAVLRTRSSAPGSKVTRPMQCLKSPDHVMPEVTRPIAMPEVTRPMQCLKSLDLCNA